MVQVRIRAIPPNQILLCDTVKAELYFGAFKGSMVQKNLELLDAFFVQFVSLQFGERAARIYS
jgi:tRNA(fMet)-specific endonuclease VapC